VTQLLTLKVAPKPEIQGPLGAILEPKPEVENAKRRPAKTLKAHCRAPQGSALPRPRYRVCFVGRASRQLASARSLPCSFPPYSRYLSNAAKTPIARVTSKFNPTRTI
jgi:hypothetical protein